MKQKGYDLLELKKQNLFFEAILMFALHIRQSMGQEAPADRQIGMSRDFVYQVHYMLCEECFVQLW